MFFVLLNENRKYEDADKALWGHYIVPVIDSRGLCSPIPVPERNTVFQVWPAGAPGNTLYPGELVDTKHPPDGYYCIEMRDFICAYPHDMEISHNYEIGGALLKLKLKLAEEADLEFARRIQVCSSNIFHNQNCCLY